MIRRPLAAFLLALVAFPLVLAGQNWPEFRGGPAAGVGDDANLPDAWSTTKNIVWQAEIPGRGWSSPIVWGDRVFLTSVISEGKIEAAKKGLYFGGERMRPPPDVHRWVVFCLDWKTGRVLWQKLAHQAVPESSHHIKNSFASETPITDGERVYAYFGNVGLFCYDLDGNELWSQRFPPVKTRFGWGTAASPVLHKGRLFVINDNEERSYLLALDAKTGRPLWLVERDEKSNWATPFVWANDRRTELVTAGTRRVRSYDLDGHLLWELGGMSSITIPTPFARHGLLYVGSGYVMDRQRPIYAIRPGATGDITLKEGETASEAVAWRQATIAPYNPSPLAYGDYLYVLYDRGFLACYDAKTGKEIYDRQRLDPGASGFTSSPWAYDDKVFCLSEDGDTFVIQAGRDYRMLGKNSLDELCMATPAVARGSLLIRTESKLYRIAKDGAGDK